MAEPGDQIAKPSGERLLFCRTGAQTGGQLLEVVVVYPPLSPRPPEHYHPRQEERFTVLQGAIRVGVAGEECNYVRGDSFRIPAGLPHWMHNAEREEVRLTWQTRPALRTEELLETFWVLARTGRTDALGRLNLWQTALILRHFSAEFRLCSPPRWLQCAALAVLAPIARRLGYRAVHRATPEAPAG